MLLQIECLKIDTQLLEMVLNFVLCRCTIIHVPLSNLLRYLCTCRLIVMLFRVAPAVLLYLFYSLNFNYVCFENNVVSMSCSTVPNHRTNPKFCVEMVGNSVMWQPRKWKIFFCISKRNSKSVGRPWF
jgi:hypothetical protein